MAFSPDGRRLLYYSDARGNEDVYLLDLGTKESRPLTTNPADDAFPAWAPDGKHVVFTSKRTGNKDLFLLDLRHNPFQLFLEERMRVKNSRPRCC